MKKIVIVVFLALMIATLFVGCGKTENDNKKLSIVSVNFPGYDFARIVTGELADVLILLPPGSESHSYDPTPGDIIKIQNCDLFIYTGGHGNAWVDKILKSMDKPPRTIKMLDCVEVVSEEIVEGMEHDHEHEDAQEHEDALEHEDKDENKDDLDEHVWTSPLNAIKISEVISSTLSTAFPSHSQQFDKNLYKLKKDLEHLDADFRAFFSNVKNKTLLFGDRFPLRYFTKEYGLKYYAAFPGCSNETEPSAATVAFLIEKVKEEKLSTVFYIEFSNHKMADAIAEATGAKTALFHTVHNVSPEDMKNGSSYESLMRMNLETLKSCLR